MLRTIALAALLTAAPAVAGPCDAPLDASISALKAARERTEIMCETDATLTGPCSQAIIAENKVIDAGEAANRQCKAAIDRANAAIGVSKPEAYWSYDPPPPWKPE